MLNAAEQEICPANKTQITKIENSFLLSITEHVKLSLAELSLKNGFLTSGPGLSLKFVGYVSPSTFERISQTLE